MLLQPRCGDIVAQELPRIHGTHVEGYLEILDGWDGLDGCDFPSARYFLASDHFSSRRFGVSPRLLGHARLRIYALRPIGFWCIQGFASPGCIANHNGTVFSVPALGRNVMAKMKVAQVAKPKADFEIVERDIPQPGPGTVRIKVHACGICFSDHVTKDGLFPWITYPRVPGHEVAGVVDEVGSGVTIWKTGQRVGVGWHGGQDGTCLSCRRGDFSMCANIKISGASFDGGYGEYMVAPQEAVAAIPDGLDFADAGPLMCAGITTFNALRHSGALPGDLVAVQGIGGLGHLGVQFASKFGYHTVAIGRGPENGELARKLGASAYIDSKATNAAAELQKLGGARVILATATSSQSMTDLVDGLGPNGSLMIIGAPSDPVQATPVQLIFHKASIRGWSSGIPTDSEDTMRVALLTGVRPMIEKFPFAKVNEAYARMTSGHAQFRVVLEM
jgi:D-arabinose 1-dehydrogenase-like Zn-dependent alcohol dehydrogenase